MTQPLFSIIIPVYNGEEYLGECLNSIRHQGMKDYEVILVNDGSVDRSLEICRSFQEKDSRIKLLSTDNHGVSHARNLGIAHAAGEWLLFLDCDDYLTEGSLEKLRTCLDPGVEEVCANYFRKDFCESDSMEAVVDSQDLITMILDPVNHRLLPEFYHLESATLLGVWGKLFSRRMIVENHLYFDEKLKLSEDMLFHINYLKQIRQVRLLEFPVFCYREHEQSVTRNFREEYVDNRLYLFEQMEHQKIKDAVFVTSTMLLLICQVEKYTHGRKRKELEDKIVYFWRSNRWVLAETENKKISSGKWQNQVYKVSVRLFMEDFHRLAFAFLRIYAKIS